MMNLMAEQQFSYKQVDNWNIHEIVDLYKAAGWWKDSYEASHLPLLMKGSFIFVLAVDNKTEKAVGMGRVISDGISDGYIQDVVVLPAYRKKGIGKAIIKELITFCQSKGVNWVALISEPGQSDFYKPLGFNIMKQYVPMKYEM